MSWICKSNRKHLVTNRTCGLNSNHHLSYVCLFCLQNDWPVNKLSRLLHVKIIKDIFSLLCAKSRSFVLFVSHQINKNIKVEQTDNLIYLTRMLILFLSLSIAPQNSFSFSFYAQESLIINWNTLSNIYFANSIKSQFDKRPTGHV